MKVWSCKCLLQVLNGSVERKFASKTKLWGQSKDTCRKKKSNHMPVTAGVFHRH